MASMFWISISVYDATLPEWDYIPVDIAERHSCKLIYEGQDDKFQPIMSSRLEFSLEVPHESSTETRFYDTLFTGDELRWKVVLADQDGDELWQGFLLPDEYNEPFTTGAFFVNFTAVDNLGILKGKKLPASFFRARHSFSKILTDCLKQTGLSLPILVSPSIQMYVANTRIDKWFLHGSTWLNNDTKADTYQILEDVLTAMGCTLFQQEGHWHIVGLHARASGNFSRDLYSVDGVYDSDGYISLKKPVRANWNASPQLTLKPPFKAVEITSGVDVSNYVFPEDIVRQPFIKSSESEGLPLPRYWVGTGLTPSLFTEDNKSLPTYVDTPLEINNVVVGYETTIGDPSYAQQLANYISLKVPPYVRGGNGETLDVSFEIKTATVSLFSDPGDVLTDDFLPYDILLNGTSIITNKQGFTDRDSYRLKFEYNTVSFGVYVVTASLNIEGFIIPENGFLDIRFHHLGDVDGSSYVDVATHITNLSMSFSSEEENPIIKTRSLNRTNLKEVTLAIGDTVLDNINNGIVYLDNIPSEYMSLILFQRFDNLSVAGEYYDRIYHFNTSNYALFQAHSDSLYIKKANSDYYQYVKDVTDIGAVGAYNLVAMNLLGEDQIKSGDLLYWRSSYTGDPNTAIMHNIREQWSKVTNPTTEQRYGAILAEVMHDQYQDVLMAFEGTTKGIIFPDDYVLYDVKEVTYKWVPTRLDIEFGENETRTTLIEYKNKKVTDYL